jgi:hypothetical protein
MRRTRRTFVEHPERAYGSFPSSQLLSESQGPFWSLQLRVRGVNSVMVRITHWNEPLSSLDIDYVAQLLRKTESPGGDLEW